MSKGDWLGEFEQTVMLAVLRLGDDAYGMEVRREIARRSGRESSIGAVYATLERLQEKDLMNSREIEPETGKGRLRRAYRRYGEWSAVAPAGSLGNLAFARGRAAAAHIPYVFAELEAEYEKYIVPERGRPAAQRWFWSQAMRSVGPLAMIGRGAPSGSIRCWRSCWRRPVPRS
jgi:hypothetical protein